MRFLVKAFLFFLLISPAIVSAQQAKCYCCTEALATTAGPNGSAVISASYFGNGLSITGSVNCQTTIGANLTTQEIQGKVCSDTASYNCIFNASCTISASIQGSVGYSYQIFNNGVNVTASAGYGISCTKSKTGNGPASEPASQCPAAVSIYKQCRDEAQPFVADYALKAAKDCHDIVQAMIDDGKLKIEPINTGCATPGWVKCGGICTDLTSNSANCGSCGNRCVAGHACSNNLCQ